MPSRCRVCRPSVALAAAALIVPLTARSPAQTRYASPNASPPPVAPGLRTDRLSAHQQERWRRIVAVVLADDDLRRPLHPTLRRLWNDVATSGHAVHVELPEPSIVACSTAGLFRVESVRPDGHVVAVLRLYLGTIDRGKVGSANRHGFRRFHRLGRERRYTEVLGHELGHAAFTLADPDRARDLLRLQDGLGSLSRSYAKAKQADRPAIRARMRRLGEQIEALEPPALAAEARVWWELVAGQTAQGPKSASSDWPDPLPVPPPFPTVGVD